jgi:uncharacterized cofD-like protein
VSRLVAVGGGSGLAVLLRGLKHRVRGAQTPAPAEEGRASRVTVASDFITELAAVVTMSDDGGSSGRLRRDFGVLPPGDIRNCIVALADDEDQLARLFQYRFPTGGDLAGHSFGNLFLTALTGITGDFYQAILTAESILSVRGRILPATLTDTRLRARGLSGRVYEGESAIGSSGERLAAVEMVPSCAPAFPVATDALLRADRILLGPGSLYTSILPNLLIPGIRAAVRESGGHVVLLLNLMTQPGETDELDALAHLDAIEQHAGPGLVDSVLVNSTPLPEGPLRLYAIAGAKPVTVDRAAFERRGVEVIEADLLASGGLIRHDPRKLTDAILHLAPAGAPR